ncbi:MAG TPA: hypothetical protein PKD95_02370 [Candidatus Paceibacterota bacterium]|nr:hypothetical protein [Candidatus Paceibacterota bacterium]
MQSVKIIRVFGINSLILMGFFGFFLVAGAQENTATNGAPPNETVRSEQRSNIEVQQGTRVEAQETRQETRVESQETRQENRTEAAELRQETRAENIETRQVLREERMGALAEVRQKRILNLSANISNRLEAAIARLFIISDRIAARIEKLAAAGIATSAASSKLREANDYLAQARANLANIDEQVYNATTSPEPRANWENVRATYAETSRLIRSAHQALRETISLLKAAVTERNQNPSAAVENSNAAATEAE